MSEAARFELVEGATLALPDGSTVTVRDGQLELSDGRRLPMPAAGEAITVEKTVSRPDGGTTRIKHTIRLSDVASVVETPSLPFAGAGPGGSEEEAQVTETVPPPENGVVTALEATPTAADDVTPASAAPAAEEAASGPQEAPVTDGQLPEVPSQHPAAGPVTPADPVLMGINCGRRSLREMLWGSIPESGFGEDEDEPKAPPKGLLNKSYSIKEEDESEHEDGEDTHEEALEASENADESFEFVEGKGKEPGKKSLTEKEPETEIPDIATKEAVKEQKPQEDDKSKPDQDKDNENKSNDGQASDDKSEPETEKKSEGFSVEFKPGASLTEAKFPTLDSIRDFEPGKLETKDKEGASEISHAPQMNSPNSGGRATQEVPTEADAVDLTSDSPAAIPATDDSTADPAEEPSADPAADAPHEKPLLTRQDKLLSSTNLVAQVGTGLAVRVGVPLLDAAVQRKPTGPAEESPAAGPTEEGEAPPAGPRSDEVPNDLHLKLTPILRSLKSDDPQSAAADADGARDARPPPSEDRKGTVPPNTPAVAEDREATLGAEEQDADTEPVSVPRVVSYYESISPRASPAPTRHPETSAVPKVIKFAVPMQPEKVFLGGQEPDELESTPVPLAAEPAAARQEMRQVLVAVRGTPEDRDPLTALAAAAVDGKPDEPTTPSTTPEKETAPDAAPQTQPAGPEEQQQTDGAPRQPPVYKPELFEPEPKRPLILTSELVEEDAPPYETNVHDARTLPLGRKAQVVTEQPPPFGDEERSDPRDPFLPDHPRPGAALKDDGWLNTCFDLCCCCWAP